MALTGSLAISNATGRSGSEQTVTLTLTNGGTSAVNVLSVQPTKSSVAAPNHAQVPVALGLPPFLQGQVVTIGAGRTLAMPWSAVAWGLKADSRTYYLGCVVLYTDGSTTAEVRPTPVTFQVTSDPNDK